MHENDFYALAVDVETTGLRDDACVIIEIAARVIAVPGVEIGRYSTPVKPLLGAVAAGEDYALAMHRRSGLLQTAVDSGRQIEIVDDEIVAFVNSHCGESKNVFLLGNSVHFDARFIARHMPKLAARVHYRQIDVTSVNLFVQLFTGRNPMTWEKKKAHTADADLDETWAEAEAYRDMFNLKPA